MLTEKLELSGHVTSEIVFRFLVVPAEAGGQLLPWH